jgi:HEAT repeat protein
MLKDEDSGVRQAAVDALGKIAKPEDREKIIEMLKDEYSGVKQAAVGYDNKIQVILSFFQSCHAVQYSTKSLKRNIQHPWLSQ